MLREYRNLLLAVFIVISVVAIVYFSAPLEQSRVDLSNPSFAGASGWFNAHSSLSLDQYRGKNVVVVSFWSYACTECQEEIDYLNRLYNKYRGNGLMVIGVHTPEFDFERNSNNVKLAVNERGIRYPIALDNEKFIWTAFNNKYLPRRYVLDTSGKIMYDHIGMGNYLETEKVVREFLEELGTDLSNIPFEAPEPDIATRLSTPPIYAGIDFDIPLGNSEDFSLGEIVTYKQPTKVGLDKLYLEGAWQILSDRARHVYRDNGQIYVKYTGSKVDMVAASRTMQPLRIDVQLDGQYLGRSMAGEDILFDANGRSYVMVRAPGIYNVIDTEFDTHKLQLTTSSDQLDLYKLNFKG